MQELHTGISYTETVQGFLWGQGMNLATFRLFSPPEQGSKIKEIVKIENIALINLCPTP